MPTAEKRLVVCKTEEQRLVCVFLSFVLLYYQLTVPNKKTTNKINKPTKQQTNKERGKKRIESPAGRRTLHLPCPGRLE
jgi:hypothetical protein